MSNADIVTVDWAALSLGERIRYVEVEGYVVLPNLLSSERIARLKAQTAKLETKAVDYSIHQQIGLTSSLRRDHRTRCPSASDCISQRADGG